MARIKLDLPSVFAFSTEVPIRVTDLNYGGHVGNDTILGIVQEARVQYFKSMGYGELSFAGVAVIMADCAVVYKSESFHGDTLRIEVAATDFSKYGFDLYYKLTNKATGKLVAEAKTGIVCFDYQARKVALLPAEALEKLQTSDNQ